MARGAVTIKICWTCSKTLQTPPERAYRSCPARCSASYRDSIPVLPICSTVSSLVRFSREERNVGPRLTAHPDRSVPSELSARCSLRE